MSIVVAIASSRLDAAFAFDVGSERNGITTPMNLDRIGLESKRVGIDELTAAEIELDTEDVMTRAGGVGSRLCEEDGKYSGDDAYSPSLTDGVWSFSTC
jgi:hypothetical protein